MHFCQSDPKRGQTGCALVIALQLQPSHWSTSTQKGIFLPSNQRPSLAAVTANQSHGSGRVLTAGPCGETHKQEVNPSEECGFSSLKQRLGLSQLTGKRGAGQRGSHGFGDLLMPQHRHNIFVEFLQAGVGEIENGVQKISRCGCVSLGVFY